MLQGTEFCFLRKPNAIAVEGSHVESSLGTAQLQDVPLRLRTAARGNTGVILLCRPVSVRLWCWWVSAVCRLRPQTRHYHHHVDRDIVEVKPCLDPALASQANRKNHSPHSVRRDELSVQDGDPHGDPSMTLLRDRSYQKLSLRFPRLWYKRKFPPGWD